MANMSYCRFENTYQDLADCLESLVNNEVLSESEERWKNKLLDLCLDIAQDFGDQIGYDVIARRF